MSAVDLPLDLRRALVGVARVPRLLVASDYDGTMAPFVSDPQKAFPLPESVRALRALAGLDGTQAAVISGRALRDLAILSRLPVEVQLVGSHGSEFDAGFVTELGGEATALLERVVAELRTVASRGANISVETKPASAALHVRNAEPEAGQRALDEVRAGAATWDGVQVTEGKSVIELAVIATDKGQALDILRHQGGASAAVFFGDDVTDEKAFRRLHGPDIGVKVGDGESLAGYRVDTLEQVAAALAFLLEERRTWLSGADAPRIERLTMMASPRSVALLTPEAGLTWLCHPEPDSAAVFAHLLGGDEAGHFTVGPLRPSLPLSQQYIDSTMTVQTRWASLQVDDYLAHDVPSDRTDFTRVITGKARAVVTFAPRPEFGQARVRLEAEDDGLRVFGTNDPMVLRAPGITWTVTSEHGQETARAEIDPSTGPVVLELRCGTSDLGPSEVPEAERRAQAESYWHDWAAGLTLPQLKPDLMKRSALTLRGLVHADSGAIMAAATTSLPEEIGGVRNWDYRYCWLRDAALTASALVSLGSRSEAENYLLWVHDVLQTVTGPERLHPLYTLWGQSLPPEAVIDALPGYAGSRPVRVGNAANQQVQLDVFGPIVDLITTLADSRTASGIAEHTEILTDQDWDLVCAMVDAVERRWSEPDNGIWEIRGNPRHHVYSKVMCWLTVDRAIRLADTYSRDAQLGWSTLRDVIRRQVLDKGWSDEAQSFTAAYGGTDLDAATLHIGLSGLVDPSDPRFAATVTATEAELRSGATVYRYHHDDGLPGGEGGFHLCAAWLVEAYLLIGQRLPAEALFTQLVAAAGPTGLLSEEYDPVAERSLGNHPQAYSHLGLLRCAQLLAR
ncbi:trehalose-phosphatase [Rhodococcus sp. BP-349]|uniref:trehalose-phosphatase n=1 Tax=unclassified Rhodococcus (in: high G+C Gram-positive bacteria) TaxID=192944 RepID=UPI001C9B92E8|nr:MULTISPECIES: trehalose-phosphatase [unclassified Rhodococcus (in: high G+C Gram-positive bacteria)]MBY6537398.1 trehalose-phosphatase [Rhodococcus sp. BP-363]MBY6541735.1 trehalose-phosphatase [Rhodococcus sp. BP-369]MBY6560965.1 trehalose-phosphatase [Rhodococcus sp. BP-370]MBY6575257.1 trehalose-phosphatase [Rhodococcus sp. BP-364]MBY6584558.1 trehalose-phosphatase [Rhodococcus sp. BP-358]